MRHLVSTLAKRDLDDIVLWIAEDSSQRIIKIAKELRAAFRKIAQNRQLYQLRSELGKMARIAVVGRHLILFKIEDNIERVVYGERNLPALFR